MAAGFARRVAIAAVMLTALAAPGVGQAQETVEEVIQAFKSGRLVQMGPVSTLLLGGMVDHLTSRCGSELSLSSGDRARLADFMSMAATRAVIGARYADPSLAEGMKSQLSGTAVYGMGGRMVGEMPCGDSASYVLRHIRQSIDSERGGGGRFVDSCASIHDRERCSCLAEIGQSVFPNFRNSEYSHDAVYGIIQANPMLGFQIAFKCRIVNY